MNNLVLLTGASGFVGRQVLRALGEKGSRVRVVVRAGTSGQFAKGGNVESIVTSADLFSESTEWWTNVCRGVHTAIHVAWYAEPGKYLQSSRNLDCLTGTLQIARGAAKSGIQRFVGIGTCFEYDLSAAILSVDTPLRPLTPYAAAKAAAFLVLTQWFSQQRVQFSWCRLFYLYGEGEDERRLIPYLRAQLRAGKPAELTAGNQIRDFLDVQIAGRMIADVALSDTIGPINICSGIPRTVRQLAEEVADEYGRRDLLRFGARPENLIDPPCVVGIAPHNK